MSFTAYAPHRALLDFVFGASDTAKDQALLPIQLIKHLHVVVPDFTNSVTATVTIEDGDGRVLWTSAAKAKGASYNLESEEEWYDQVISSDLSIVVTLSGAPGGTGGTVEVLLRYL